MFRESRETEMLNTLTETQGLATPNQIDDASRRGNNKAIERVGNKSEKNFGYYASRSHVIREAINPNPIDDAKVAIDQWVLLKDVLHLPPLPVQIKSSPKDVNLFKYGENGTKPHRAFTKLNGLMIVINCGPSSDIKSFDQDLKSEIQRIRSIIHENPATITNLENITPKRLKDSNSFKIRYN